MPGLSDSSPSRDNCIPVIEDVSKQTVAPGVSNIHPMATRSKTGIFRSKVFSSSLVEVSVEPKSYKEAMKHEVWLDAMKKEMKALKK